MTNTLAVDPRTLRLGPLTPEVVGDAVRTRAGMPSDSAEAMGFWLEWNPVGVYIVTGVTRASRPQRENQPPVAMEYSYMARRIGRDGDGALVGQIVTGAVQLDKNNPATVRHRPEASQSLPVNGSDDLFRQIVSPIRIVLAHRRFAY